MPKLGIDTEKTNKFILKHIFMTLYYIILIIIFAIAVYLKSWCTLYNSYSLYYFQRFFYHAFGSFLLDSSDSLIL